MSHITSGEGLKLPQSIGGNLDLNSISNIEEIEFPEDFKITRDIYLATGPVKYEELILKKSNKHR